MNITGWVRESRERAKTKGKVNALYWSATEFLAGVGRETLGRSKKGTPIWEKEWDILCILDGCRPDLLEHVAVDFPWITNIEQTLSVASASASWMDRTFAPRYQDQMASTAYITANPFSAHADGDEQNLPLSKSEFGFLSEVWREAEAVAGGATPPRPVTDHAIAAWRRKEELGIDRMIIHYMQPHEPFLTDPQICEGDGTVWTTYRDANVYTRARILAGYRDTLHSVLEDIAILRENCTAEHMVLTADHGNALGEWNVFGHRHNVQIDAIRAVPWAVVEAQDQNSYQPAVSISGDTETGSGNQNTDSTIQDRLSDLGYITD